MARASDVLTAVKNPPNPFLSTHLEWEGKPPKVQLNVLHDASRTILSKNDSPDIRFTYSVNPYRGCMHACAYCYARPTHQYLDLGAGTDFDRRIVVKPNAPELLREAFSKRSWRGDVIVFSGNTDCYQPIEAHYELTRRCLEVCAEFKNPVSIITKSSLVERDLDVLSELAATSWLCVTMSIPFADADTARAIEPFAPTPRRRFKTVRRLADAGVNMQVNVAPIIPGLNDRDIPTLLEQAAEAGATSAGHTLVRLPGPVETIFIERIRTALPLQADKILNRLADARRGQNAACFGERMIGRGNYWDAIEMLWRTNVARLGLNSCVVNVPEQEIPSTFQRPWEGKQLDMFSD